MAVYKDKNGTWYVSARYTNWKGEADRKVKRGFQTKREAAEWEKNFFLENAGNLDMTFEAFYQLYKQNTKDRIKLNTWKMKESVIEGKILPYFRSRRMNEIKPRDVVNWQNTMMKMTDENGKPFSPVYRREKTVIFLSVKNTYVRAVEKNLSICWVDKSTDQFNQGGFTRAI